MSSSSWIKVCNVDDLVDNSGVCALVEDKQVALFKLAGADDVYAIGNWDPLGKANVLSRGIIGSINDAVVVASPLYKQHFCLKTGMCFEDDDVTVPVYATRVEDLHVFVQVAS
ncbi:nitrite reductase small subunit NirD [Alteromonadaceae bacterium BrNp21-10]|nr:nitrite reductase small subunit NirD [Alteromonadaceae bacterium BrNp21-10]